MTVTDSRFDVSIIELPGGVRDADLVAAFMRFRKSVFVDQMAWPLRHIEGSEFEQYDTFDTTYIVAHRGREVLGGARLKRTDATYGRGSVVYSYMIRDAFLGLLPGMPSALCNDDPPVDSKIWELTRFVSDEKAPGCSEAILRAANSFLYERGATSCLFLGPPAFLRMARRLGWSSCPMGPIVGNSDGRFLAFSCGVVSPEVFAQPAYLP